MDLIEYVQKAVDPTAYYKKRIPEWSGNCDAHVICPFHEEDTPSFSVNIKDTGGCFCFGCGKRIGSIIHFEKEASDPKMQEDVDAARSVYAEFIHPIMESDPPQIDIILNTLSESLLANKSVLEMLQSDLGIDEKTVHQFQLGYYTPKKRITIPILDQFGQLVNIRYYQLPSTRGEGTKYPKIYSEDGYGSPPVMFPLPHVVSLFSTRFKPSILYFTQGERDTLLAWHLGVPSFTVAGGENTELRPEWIKFLLDLQIPIAIIGDNDKPGREGAQKKLVMMLEAGIPTVRVELPDEYKDFSNWILEGEGTAKLLRDMTPTPNEGFAPREKGDGPSPFERSFEKVKDPKQNKIEGEFTVADIGRKPQLLNGMIQVRAVVSGKVDRTYSIPNLFRTGNAFYRMPISRELVQMVNMKDEKIVVYVKNLLATKSAIIPMGRITVTEVEIIPMIVPGVDSFYVNQRCFYFGEKIESNLPYIMSVIPTSEMDTQETIGLIVDIAPVSNSLDEFNFDENIRMKLANRFGNEAKNGKGVVESLQTLAQEISNRHSLIYNRVDLHIMALLTWLSPLQFNFFREGVQRGWMNSLAIGDTQTGKSEVAEALQKLFNCGVFINSENCTYVGLIGGAVKSSTGMFMLRWGKIPLYNRQLVIIEEMSGISTEQISHMSDVRSSGIARLDKGGLSGETSARTRLLCLSNVRDKYGSLAAAQSGVIALQELVGHNEDISRFDLITTLVDAEVSNEIINSDRSEENSEQTPYSEEEVSLFRSLIMFVWSLKPDQIEITRGAYICCLQKTLELAKEYHPNVPIFKAGSGRLKLARIACAIAAIQFNWDEDKQVLVVENKHVEAAVLFLRLLYNKHSFGYQRYSKQTFFLESLHDEPKLMSALKKVLIREDQHTLFFRYLSQINFFAGRELTEALGIATFMAERVVSAMFSANAIHKSKKNPLHWEITMPGRKWIERNGKLSSL